MADLINGAFRSCAKTITKLDLDDNDLTGDIEIFQKLENVERLYLSNNRRLVGDISSFAGLDKLKSLWLNGCEKLVGDVSSFASLDKLEQLRLRGCEKLVGDRDQQLQADLPNCGIRFW